jgi:hypothetical protein
VLGGHAKVLTPFLYVSEPIGRSIWVQLAIGRNAVDDDRGVPENAEEKIVVLGVDSGNIPTGALPISSLSIEPVRRRTTGGVCPAFTYRSIRVDPSKTP